MQVSINDGITIHINMNMIIGICGSFNVNTSVRIIHSRFRLNISVSAGMNTGIILNIQQIINFSISLINIVMRVSNSVSVSTDINLMICS